MHGSHERSRSVRAEVRTTRAVAIAAMFAVATILVACASSSPPTLAGASPAPVPASSPTAYFSAQAQGLSFTYPRSWNVGRYPEDNSSQSALLGAFSNQAMHNPCHATATGGVCADPIDHLVNNGFLVSWYAMGPIFTFDQQKGALTAVNGHAAKQLGDPWASECLQLGGNRSNMLAIAGSQPDSWFFMYACMRGPDTAQVVSQIDEMLRSVRVPSSV